jgi:predicted TPR repeat methyltransferase
MGGRKAKAGMTRDAGAQLAAAIGLHQQGRLEEAEKIYLGLLQANPDNVDALHFLGLLRHQQGQSLRGIELVRRAIEMRPDYVDAISNLGAIYRQLGGTAEAVEAYRKALELRPDHPETLRNLGIGLRKLKRYEEAVELHQRALEQQPGRMENYRSLASAYKDVGRIEEAIATLRKALAIQPDAETFHRLGQMLYGLRRIDEAAANYEAWLQAEPGNPVPKHMLAACTLRDVPARAADAFVASVFDGFAESFDEVLTQRLEYRAPALVGAALKRTDGEPRGELHIVDAGCGTGLLAQYLRPYARRLVGVDLSTKMLQKAARRGLYDDLAAAELMSYLSSSPQAFDVVASSDTLVYFGDLREVLATARESLRMGGRLLFTLEHAPDDDEVPAGYRIHPHGRYSHAEPYVRRTLAEAGFEVLDIERAPLRREGSAYVAGLVVAARLTKRTENVTSRPPGTAREKLARAGELHRQGELAQAEAQYLELLHADANDPGALYGLGVLRHQQGQTLAALNLVQRVVELRPMDVEAHMTLGSVYRQLGSIAGAAAAYNRALELRPDHPEALAHAAPVLEELKRLQDAAEAHRRGSEQEPGKAEPLYALAGAYLEMGRVEDTIATLRKALEIRPEASAFRRLGAMLQGIGRLDEAVATYEAWLAVDRENPVAKHMLAACTGKNVPERASDGFVTLDFDRFAERFDAVLGNLEYRAPALVADALRRRGGEPRGDLDVMDAGCGTGLLAQHVRPYARRLVGVDLSPRMLEKARARAVYDELVAAELSAYLVASPQAFDVVASSDTLIYFGDLREVFAAAYGSMRPGGWVVFTLEHAVNVSLPAGYRLTADGRYMHTEEYVRGVLDQAGYEAIDIQKGNLRREGDAYVAGLVVAARRPRQ